MRFAYLFVKNRFSSFEYLQLQIQGLTLFQYLQMMSVVSGFQGNNLLRMGMTKFELELKSGVIFRNTLSRVYDILVRDEEAAEVS